MVISTADEIAPTASVRPFIDAMPEGNVCLIEHASEMGVGLQHLAILVGQQAHAQVWPKIASWLHVHA